MIFITGSKTILLDFYFKNNVFSDKNKLSSLYYIKPYFIKNLKETIIQYQNYGEIYKLYYSDNALKDKIIVYKDSNEYTLHG